jgi:hypothetical protein
MPPTTRSKQAQCRFCLEDDDRNNLLAPCICKGSFKYVHPACLIQWYEHEPVKGLQCSACLEPFSREGLSELEALPYEYELSILNVHRPYIAIPVYHWCFIVFFHYIWYIPATTEQYALMYHMFQGVFHGMYLLRLRTFFSRVKNVDVFMKEWFSRSIQLIPFLHVGCLAMMWKTGFLGGIAADMCMFLYFYELFDVLHTINHQRSITITFTNR